MRCGDGRKSTPDRPAAPPPVAWLCAWPRNEILPALASASLVMLQKGGARG